MPRSHAVTILVRKLKMIMQCKDKQTFQTQLVKTYEDDIRLWAYEKIYRSLILACQADAEKKSWLEESYKQIKGSKAIATNHMIPVSHPIFNEINFLFIQEKDFIHVALDRYVLPWRWGAKSLFYLLSFITTLTKALSLNLIVCGFDLCLVYGVSRVINIVTRGKYDKQKDHEMLGKAHRGWYDRLRRFMDLGFGLTPIVVVAKTFLETLKKPISHEHPVLSVFNTLGTGLAACILIPLFSILHLVNQWVIQPPIILLDYVLQATCMVVGEILILPINIMGACRKVWQWLYQDPKGGRQTPQDEEFDVPPKLSVIPSTHPPGPLNKTSKLEDPRHQESIIPKQLLEQNEQPAALVVK